MPSPTNWERRQDKESSKVNPYVWTHTVDENLVLKVTLYSPQPGVNNYEIRLSYDSEEESKDKWTNISKLPFSNKTKAKERAVEWLDRHPDLEELLDKLEVGEEVEKWTPEKPSTPSDKLPTNSQNKWQRQRARRNAKHTGGHHANYKD